MSILEVNFKNREYKVNVGDTQPASLRISNIKGLTHNGCIDTIDGKMQAFGNCYYQLPIPSDSVYPDGIYKIDVLDFNNRVIDSKTGYIGKTHKINVGIKTVKINKRKYMRIILSTDIPLNTNFDDIYFKYEDGLVVPIPRFVYKQKGYKNDIILTRNVKKLFLVVNPELLSCIGGIAIEKKELKEINSNGEVRIL